MEIKEAIIKLYRDLKEEIDEYTHTDESKKLTVQIANLMGNLGETLPKEQIQQVEKIIILEEEKVDGENENTFVYAFCLATRLISESLCNSNFTLQDKKLKELQDKVELIIEDLGKKKEYEYSSFFTCPKCDKEYLKTEIICDDCIEMEKKEQ